MSNFANVTDKNIDMWGTILEFKGEGQTSNGAFYKQVTLADSQGVKHSVRIYQGTGELPPVTMLNQLTKFTISSFESTNKAGVAYTGYSGFWNGNAVQGVSPQVQPQASPSPPFMHDPSVAQEHAVQQALDKKFPIKTVSKNTSFAMAYAKDLVIGGKLPIDDMYSEAQKMLHFMDTGKEMPQQAPPQVTQSYTPDPNDSIPF